MTPDEINKAIADRLGLLVPETQRPESLWPDVFIAQCANRALTPNYCSDLNAMHEAEKTLSEASKAVYAETLCAIVGGRVVDWGYYPGEAEIEWHSIAALIFATPAQKAEALLRTLNPWKE